MTHENYNPNEVDARLGGAEQQFVAEVVRSLPSEEPTLQSRAELSSRIMAEATRLQRKRRTLWIWRPTAGLAIAGALAFVLVSRTPTTTPVASSEFESSLVTAHNETLNAQLLSDTAVQAVVTNSGSGEAATTVSWEESDLGF